MNLHGKIIIDFDDVLAETSKALYLHIKFMWPMYCPNIKDLPIDLDVTKREHKDIMRDIVKDDITDERFLGLISTLFSNYYNNPGAYTQYFKTTKLYDSIMSSEVLLSGNKIDKIYILTGSFNDDDYKVKYDVLKELFSNEKIEIIRVEDKESDVIKKLDWNLYITDNKNVIKHLIEDPDYNISEKEFLVLDRPYSKLEQKEEVLIEEKGATINYYK